jgi:hypothetical protein
MIIHSTCREQIIINVVTGVGQRTHGPWAGPVLAKPRRLGRV